MSVKKCLAVWNAFLFSISILKTIVVLFFSQRRLLKLKRALEGITLGKPVLFLHFYSVCSLNIFSKKVAVPVSSTSKLTEAALIFRVDLMLG